MQFPVESHRSWAQPPEPGVVVQAAATASTASTAPARRAAAVFGKRERGGMGQARV
jgi:hypothetical protein